jgi:hypothetical protein
VECSPDVTTADAALAPLLTEELLTEVLALVPDAWLVEEPQPPHSSQARGGPLAAATEAPDDVRARYVSQLLARLAARGAWLPGLVAAAAAGGAGRRAAPRGQNRPGWLGPPPPEGITQR